MSTTDDPPQAGNRRRWFQFGLSALLLAMAVIAILIAWQRPRIERWLEALRGRPPSSPPLVIKIDSDGGVFAGRRHVAKDSLKPFLAKKIEFLQLDGYLAEGEKPRAVVLAEAATPMQSVREVIDIVRQAGFSEIELRPDK